MKKNNKPPELATFTLLNPDFHAMIDKEENGGINNENSGESKLTDNPD